MRDFLRYQSRASHSILPIIFQSYFFYKIVRIGCCWTYYITIGTTCTIIEHDTRSMRLNHFDYFFFGIFYRQSQEGTLFEARTAPLAGLFIKQDIRLQIRDLNLKIVSTLNNIKLSFQLQISLKIYIFLRCICNYKYFLLKYPYIYNDVFVIFI